MQLVKPSIEMLDTSDQLKLIELVGRTCYKSEDKIGEGTAEKFVAKLIERGHFAMIEFSNFIFEVSPHIYNWITSVEDHKYIRLTMDGRFLVSGSARAFIEFYLDTRHVSSATLIKALQEECLSLFKDIELDMSIRAAILPLSQQVRLISDETLKEHEYLIHFCFGYKVICNRGVTHEIVRHRPYSFAQESTRFCNYKGGVTFIIPPQVLIQEEFINTEVSYFHGKFEIENKSGSYHPDIMNGHWLEHMQACETAYQICINREWTPQQARGVLPIDLKTEINIYGNVKQWVHFFNLRCSPKAHPQMQEIANMIKEDLIEKDILEFEKGDVSC